MVTLLESQLPASLFPPGTGTVLFIGTVCLGIFSYYHHLQHRLGTINYSEHERKHLRLMDKHVVLSLDNRRAGRWWTLLTSTITHYSPLSLALNMCALSLCGPPIVQFFGLPTFIGLWAVGGVVGGATQLYIDKQSRQRGVMRKGLGASACMCVMEAVLTCANPHAVVSISDIFVPQWVSMAAFAGWSVAALRQGWGPGIGHEAHLGGLAAGIVVWFGALRWSAPSITLQMSRLFGV